MSPHPPPHPTPRPHTPPPKPPREIPSLTTGPQVWVLSLNEDASRFRPWWGTMTHGIAIIGEPGAGVWRAKSRRRLIRKMAKAAARMGASQGEERIIIAVDGTPDPDAPHTHAVRRPDTRQPGGDGL